MILTRTTMMEVRVSPWKPLWWNDPRYGAVRIWMQTDGLRWWQCHEWERKDGNQERWIDGWIGIPKAHRWPDGFVDPAPGDEPPP